MNNLHKIAQEGKISNIAYASIWLHNHNNNSRQITVDGNDVIFDGYRCTTGKDHLGWWNKGIPDLSMYSRSVHNGKVIFRLLKETI